MIFSTLSTISVSLSDPTGAHPLVAAVSWLQQALLGTIAQTVAIVAIAWIGLSMLSGRINVRRGVTVVAGCFTLFGATTIVTGLQSFIAGRDGADPVLAGIPAPPPVVIPLDAGSARDPYAGASVPPR